jgi:hypothetical protein
MNAITPAAFLFCSKFPVRFEILAVSTKVEQMLQIEKTRINQATDDMKDVPNIAF